MNEQKMMELLDKHFAAHKSELDALIGKQVEAAVEKSVKKLNKVLADTETKSKKTTKKAVK